MTQSIQGYGQLSVQELSEINGLKVLGEQIANQLDHLACLDSDEAASQGVQRQLCDPRWLAIARTNMQQGLMAAVRAVAKPTGF